MTAMTNTNRNVKRREALTLGAVSLVALPMLGCTSNAESVAAIDDEPTIASEQEDVNTAKTGEAMQVHYLEIVTDDVAGACSLYSSLHGVAFSDADPSLGGARTAKMTDGSTVGVRAPMHAGEKVVTRAYFLVDDIKAAVAEVEKSEAQLIVPPMEIPGHGMCAIYIQGGIEAGLWQV